MRPRAADQTLLTFFSSISVSGECSSCGRIQGMCHSYVDESTFGHLLSSPLQKGRSNSTGLECEGQYRCMFFSTAFVSEIRRWWRRSGCLEKLHPGGGDIRTWWWATALQKGDITSRFLKMLDEQDQAVWFCIYLPCDQSHTLPCEIARPLLPVAYVLVYLHVCGNGNAQCLSSESTEDGITRMLEAAAVPA
jgi:hypothetical protein